MSCSECKHSHEWDEPFPYGDTMAYKSMTECQLHENGNWDETEFGEWDDDYLENDECPAQEDWFND